MLKYTSKYDCFMPLWMVLPTPTPDEIDDLSFSSFLFCLSACVSLFCRKMGTSFSEDFFRGGGGGLSAQNVVPPYKNPRPPVPPTRKILATPLLLCPLTTFLFFFFLELVYVVQLILLEQLLKMIELMMGLRTYHWWLIIFSYVLHAISFYKPTVGRFTP